MISVYEKVFVHPTLNNTIDALLHNQFIFGIENCDSIKIDISRDDVKKSVWLASILVSSDKEVHQSKAQLFSSLLYLQHSDDVDVERVCYVLMSRLGNLPATNLFNGLKDKNTNNFSKIDEYDALLSFELAFQKENKRIAIASDLITTTKFQKELWNELNQKMRLSISAPTSAGKSFITKKYIKQLFSNSDEAKCCFYIVPSRALINQVSEEFRIELNDLAKVYTAFLEPTEISQNSIYILTPERCLRILKYSRSVNMKVDLIFIDEVQNVEDEGGRGTLLEYVISELVSTFPSSQIVVAGPNLDNPASLLTYLTGEDSNEIKTALSPVIQIRSVIKGIDDKKISIKLLSNIEDKIELSLDIGFDLEKTLKGNIGLGLSKLIKYLVKDEQTIVYSPKTNLAEIWAKKLAEHDSVSINLDRRVTELIDYLAEEIHPKYYLIKCLNCGIAFHHGRLPEMVRKEVEDCFIDKKLSTLFCTSTLIEGVNLPARNLFVIKPQKLDTDLSNFEFGNLIGRAGRIGESLYGNVYCIERQEHQDWATTYFEGSFKKTVIPSTEKALNNFQSLIERVSLVSSGFERDAELEKNTIILFRHKYLNNSEIFKQYLLEKGIGLTKTEQLVNGIALSLNNVTIPNSIIEFNPGIDPILQDRLYKQIISDGVENWIVHWNGNIRTPMSKMNVENYPFKDRNLFWQLVRIMQQLDDIFNIRNETWYKHNVSLKISQMCLYGVRWLQGDSYSMIIKSDIDWKTKNASDDYPFDPNSEDDINKVIENLARVNNTIVSYVLVKYMKLLNDILEPLLSESQLEDYKFSLGLPGMLELGTTNGSIIQLISSGISRSVALKVYSLFEKVSGHEEMNVFDWLKSNKTINLKPIYNRYLTKLKLLKTDN